MENTPKSFMPAMPCYSSTRWRKDPERKDASQGKAVISPPIIKCPSRRQIESNNKCSKFQPISHPFCASQTQRIKSREINEPWYKKWKGNKWKEGKTPNYKVYGWRAEKDRQSYVFWGTLNRIKPSRSLEIMCKERKRRKTNSDKTISLKTPNRISIHPVHMRSCFEDKWNI